jgi:hypothetical protein
MLRCRAKCYFAQAKHRFTLQTTYYKPVNTLAANPYFWLTYFVLAFAMGYWNYRKGHNLMIGVFISLLLTPLTGLLFNIFTKSNREVIRQRNTASMKPVRCASCGEMIPAKSNKCRKCGALVGEKKMGRN